MTFPGQGVNTHNIRCALSEYEAETVNMFPKLPAMNFTNTVRPTKGLEAETRDIFPVSSSVQLKKSNFIR
jgi:hypothetical protein